jgi:ABC-type transport system substrate-binding protein
MCKRRGLGGLTALLLVAGAVLALPAVQARPLRTTITADPAMIDPVTYSELIAGDILKNVYEGFTDTDKDGNIVPVLAESWTADPDNLGFRFKLRAGVRFHSGRPFTARDVKFTFEQLLTPGSRAGLQLQYLKKIVGADAMQKGEAKELAGVTVVDDLTVHVRFVEPEVLFPIYPFMFVDSGIVAEAGANWWQTVSAGTGPFRFVHWRRGQEVRLAAHQGYWGGAPKVTELVFLVVPAEDTAVSMFEAGEVELVTLGGDTARRVLRDAKFRPVLRQHPVAQVTYLGMNQALYPPFRDKRVREAFCIAFDREGMVRGLLGGAGQPLFGQIAPGVAGYNAAFPAIRHDRDRARRLLAEAGFPNGQGLPPLKIANTAPNRNEVAYLADQYRQVLNVPVEVDIVERATFIRSMNAGEVPFFSWGWSAGFPDAYYFLSQMWHSKSTFNRPRYVNTAFDQLIDRASTVADNEARYKLYHEAEKLLMDDWGTCGLFVRSTIALVRPNVKGVELTAFRYLPFGGVVVE